ncbi:MAG: helicase associated domain-containing protein [Paracoccaceae bacterium]|nr:helicase associated domain-containing protein [Paracoccaceae bacterium]MDG2258019.1 helicase associated domain-containing protein [Paracoccaceae bacterium]
MTAWFQRATKKTVSHQRRAQAKGKLSKDRQEKLEAIGFIWDAAKGKP